MNPQEIQRLQAYLKSKLNPNLRLVSRKETDDSVEVFLGDEFVAVVYKDTEDGDVSYAVTMTVLSEDLEG